MVLSRPMDEGGVCWLSVGNPDNVKTTDKLEKERARGVVGDVRLAVRQEVRPSPPKPLDLPTPPLAAPAPTRDRPFSLTQTTLTLRHQ